MRDAETTLAIIEDRGKRGLQLDRIYRRLFNEDLYLRAYGRLYRNDGAMTRGATPETVDGMSRPKIEGLIEMLRKEQYRWTPVRRKLIPKGNGKTRPLGIPTWSDKLLQEVIRSILEAYFEPQFSPNSHGFRPGRGCHTAMKDIFIAWRGTKWFIEGDIKGCFDNIDHSVLMSILREKILDGRLLNLIEALLKAGYLEQWDYRPTLSGTPQGGIISPLLANIYMDRLDKFVEKTLIPEFTRGAARKRDPIWIRLNEKVRRLRKKGATWETIEPFFKEMKSLPSSLPLDQNYRRLRYIRYADDFLLGFCGHREEAEQIKDRIGTFLRDHLKLEMSPEKTLITHAGTEQARFLGYDIGINTHRLSKGSVELRVPVQKLEAKVARYTNGGKPIHRSEMINDTDFTIVSKYGSEYQGFAQYYAYAINRHWIKRLRWVMGVSMLKTLAAKHKSSVMKMAREFQSRSERDGLRCFEVVVEREGKKPLIARFGGFPLRTQPFLIIEDRPLDTDRSKFQRTELITRLLNDTCELCGSRKDVQVHHIRKLSDLKVPGQKEKPGWIKLMAARKRKTLVVCLECHTNIHAGRPTRKKVDTGVSI